MQTPPLEATTMNEFSTPHHCRTDAPAPQVARHWVRRTAWAGALVTALGLGGCAVEVENRQASQELARQALPQGSALAGWQVFQDKCLQCHGPDATGTARAPSLLQRMQTVGLQQFGNLVLLRYDWGLPAGEKASPAMPAWQTDPRVKTHVQDLYVYLSARSSGALGPGKPAP
jgi:mono/diheme cytochrome c family protein